MSYAHTLIQNHNLISEQVTKHQVSSILQQLERVLNQHIQGSIVEFGCYIGTTSVFIRRMLDAYADNRELHVYDSFAGLPPKTKPDNSVAGDQFQVGELTISKKDFLREFHKAKLQPPVVHKGWFSDLGPSDVPATIAFAFLDGDFYESIRDSLRLVLPRMQPGSVLMIDDYAREALPGVAKAVQDFLPKKLQSAIQVVHNQAIIQL